MGQAWGGDLNRYRYDAGLICLTVTNLTLPLKKRAGRPLTGRRELDCKTYPSSRGSSLHTSWSVGVWTNASMMPLFLSRKLLALPGSRRFDLLETSKTRTPDIQHMTVERLRALLKEKGLSLRGRKDELIARLKGTHD